MAGTSKIEWTDASWTPIRARNRKTGKVGWHCEHATTGCEHCYSEGMNKRLGTGLPFKPGHRKDIEIFLDEEMLLAPLRWKKPRMIFVCSMTDAFADFVTDDMLDKMFAVMALTPHHTYQVPTKRADRMLAYLSAPNIARRVVDATDYDRIHSEACEAQPWGRPRLALGLADAFAERILWESPSSLEIVGIKHWPLSNVWLGVSTERQQEADERIPLLLQTPAAVRFISAEPLLGPIDLPYVHQLKARPDVPALDWVIVGGESGRGARPMDPNWARTLRDQCARAGVPFFFKQWGEFAPLDSFSEAHPDAHVYRCGKKAAGRLLDGKEHNGFPRVREAVEA